MHPDEGRATKFEHYARSNQLHRRIVSDRPSAFKGEFIIPARATDARSSCREPALLCQTLISPIYRGIFTGKLTPPEDQRPSPLLRDGV